MRLRKIVAVGTTVAALLVPSTAFACEEEHGNGNNGNGGNKPSQVIKVNQKNVAKRTNGNVNQSNSVGNIGAP